MTIDELENYFNSVELPQTISIKQGERITDVRAFVKGHVEIVRKNGNVPAFGAFYERLYMLWEVLNYGEPGDAIEEGVGGSPK